MLARSGVGRGVRRVCNRRGTRTLGARAEYWLKAHEKIGWAWVSLVCYLMGIGVLLVTLFIQCWSVAKAAWWPEKTTQQNTG